MEKLEEIEEVQSIVREVRTLYLLEHEPVCDEGFAGGLLSPL
jgi:hypothetical protein